MEIKLNKDYKVTTDQYNYALYKKCKGKTPKHLQKDENHEKGYKIVGYFGGMNDLYDNLIEHHIKVADAKSFEEVLRIIKEFKVSLCKREHA